jgi:3-oxoadipate enol-lactonase
MAREIHENLAGSQLVVIPSAAHLANIEQPQAFNRALTAFYDRVR